MAFSAKYIEHFTNPRGVGEIEPPDLAAEVKHEGGGCFDRVRLTLRLDGETIAEAKFRARACSGTIAACSALTLMVTGLSRQQASEIAADDVAEFLSGVPDQKRHSVELAARAIAAALVR